jgi:hypothetical protein
LIVAPIDLRMKLITRTGRSLATRIALIIVLSSGQVIARMVATVGAVSSDGGAGGQMDNGFLALFTGVPDIDTGRQAGVDVSFRWSQAGRLTPPATAKADTNWGAVAAP